MVSRIKPIVGGCITDHGPDLERIGALKPARPFTGELLRAPGRRPRWVEYVLPSDNQRNDTTCVIRTHAGVQEAIARYNVLGNLIPRGSQIGVQAAYHHVMETEYHGRDQGGMTIADGLKGAIGVGMLPVGCRHQEVRSLGEMQAALLRGPLVSGTFTTRAWLKPSPNGYLDPTEDRETLSSHCTLILDVLHDAGEPYILFQDWQGPRAGWHGLRIMHWSGYDATRHRSGPYLVVRPAGTERWTGWTSLLVNKEEGD